MIASACDPLNRKSDDLLILFSPLGLRLSLLRLP
jgi:hypothetical protein